jgi:hypothetical protein
MFYLYILQTKKYVSLKEKKVTIYSAFLPRSYVQVFRLNFLTNPIILVGTYLCRL